VTSRNGVAHSDSSGVAFDRESGAMANAEEPIGYTATTALVFCDNSTG